MKKALVLTVGTGQGVENGIWFSIKNQNPSLVVLITTLTSISTSDKLKPQFESNELTYEISSLKNENDVEIIFEECNSILSNLIERGFNKNQIIADYTSGTKSMSAALVLSSATFEIENISYVYGSQRDENGRVITGSERLSVLSPKVAFEIKLLQQFYILFNGFQFKTGVKLFENQFFSINRKIEAEFLINLANAFDAWDKFDFKNALRLFGDCDLEYSKKIGLKSKIENIKQWISSLERVPENIPTDLYYNALRRSKEGKFDDGVARLYRTLEMIFQIEYKKLFCEDTKVGLVETIQAIKEKESSNSIVTFYYSKENEFKKILTVRNKSILAHGQTPISENSFQEMSNLLKSILEEGKIPEFPILK